MPIGQPCRLSSQRNGAFIEYNVESKSSMVDFHKFFDCENITLQEDLVARINVGMHLVVRVLPLYVS